MMALVGHSSLQLALLLNRTALYVELMINGEGSLVLVV